jgi:hypothetical protein
MIIDIYIGNKKLDIFKDEGINLNSSVANVNDISRNFTDYTQNFTVPANDVNNPIFKHYYNANIDNTFDARTKVDGRIELGGVPFKFGKWKLLKVNVKQNKPSSYTINFTGNLFSLKEKFKDDELSSLDLSAFNHTHNSINVQNGLVGSLFDNNIIYNLFAKKQYYYNNNATDNTNTDRLANIAWGGGVNAGVQWTDLKPSLRLIKVIEAIEAKYNITFTRDFFGRTEFNDLFIWLNTDTSTGTETEQLINFTSTSGFDLGFNLSTEKWINTVGLITPAFAYNIRIEPTLINIPYKIIVKNFGVPIATIESSGGITEIPFTSVPLVNGTNTPFEYTFYVSSSFTFSYVSFLKLRRVTYSFVTGFESRIQDLNSSTSTITSVMNISNNLPKIKVIDFMKGLFNMFKLVVIADQSNNIYINTLVNYYSAGVLYDLTKYTDYSSYDVERGNILNDIKFKFQDPTTILNTQFDLNTGVPYGNLETILEDAEGNILDGEPLTIDLPFEQIIYERLPDVNDNELTNIMYGGIFDAQIEPVNPKPHLFYNRNQQIGSKSIAFRNDANTKVQLNTFINVPSHTLSIVNPLFSTVFGKEFNEWDGSLIENTLYSNYWDDYINSIFNIKRRNFKFNCKNIPERILTKLQLNDVIRIKNDYYRINDYNFNLLTGETSFNLINSFDNNLSAFIVDQSVLFADGTLQRQSVYLTNNFAFNYSTRDAWVTCTADGNVVYFDIDANTTGLLRSTVVTLQNTDTLKEVEVTVVQLANNLTFDNNIITFDTTLITFDNG